MKTGDGTRMFLLFILLNVLFFFFTQNVGLSLFLATVGTFFGIKYRKYQYKRDLKVDIDNYNSIVSDNDVRNKAIKFIEQRAYKSDNKVYLTDLEVAELLEILKNI